MVFFKNALQVMAFFCQSFGHIWQGCYKLRDKETTCAVRRRVIVKFDEAAFREFMLEDGECVAARSDSNIVMMVQQAPDNRDIPRSMTKTPAERREQYVSHPSSR
jgi:hypothetical protein